MQKTKVVIRPSNDVTVGRLVNFLRQTNNRLILCDQRLCDMLDVDIESTEDDDPIVFKSSVSQQCKDVDGYCCLHRFISRDRWYFVFLTPQESLFVPGFVGRLAKPLDAQEGEYWTRWLTALAGDCLYEAVEIDGSEEFFYDRDYLDPTDALADLIFENVDLSRVEIETYEDLYS